VKNPLFSLRQRIALCFCAIATQAHAQNTTSVATVPELLQAVANSGVGDTILLAAGTYELSASLQPKADVALVGAGIGRSIIQGASSWTRPLNSKTVDNEVDSNTVDRSAYLIDLGNNASNVRITGLTLTAPLLHGAIYGNNPDGLQIINNEIRSVQWAGIRVFRMDNGLISGNRFLDAGGRVNVTSGASGGGVFITFTNTSRIVNNRFDRSPDAASNYYGIKGQGANTLQIECNTINTNFSIELPFRNDTGVVIRNNYLAGVVSIPKADGGPNLPAGGSFHILENYFRSSYAIEGTRDGLLVERNLFDFDASADTGNLLSQFGTTAVEGPVVFTNNLMSNPGRGILSSAGRADNYSFTNNHIRGVTTITPRTEGLFGFRPDVDFTSIRISNNRIELSGTQRPLLKNSNGTSAHIQNNLMSGISDTASYANAPTGAPVGPLQPLIFRVGAFKEFRIDGFTITPVLFDDGFESTAR
jgi:hypothetical protein